MHHFGALLFFYNNVTRGNMAIKPELTPALKIKEDRGEPRQVRKALPKLNAQLAAIPGERHVEKVTLVYRNPRSALVFDRDIRGHGLVSGTPFPTEGMAWTFRMAVKVMHAFIWSPHATQLAILKRMGIKGDE
jgi:hypothetical protein